MQEVYPWPFSKYIQHTQVLEANLKHFAMYMQSSCWGEPSTHVQFSNVITHFKVTWDSVIVCNAPSCDTRCTVLELEMVDEVKALGNAVFSAGKVWEVSYTFFRGKIQLESVNHILCSHRSAACASQHKYQDALCMMPRRMWSWSQPELPKGYSHLVAASSGLGQTDEAIVA
jgi:hypothetical protein